jgi:hypothetical protein
MLYYPLPNPRFSSSSHCVGFRSSTQPTFYSDQADDPDVDNSKHAIVDIEGVAKGVVSPLFDKEGLGEIKNSNLF